MQNSSPDQSIGIKLVDFLGSAIHRLKTVGIESADVDARILTAYGLKLNRAQLLGQSERLLTAEDANLLEALIEQRVHHKSVARIMGEREFWGLNFGLNEATLEPRPDSETLIEATLKLTPDRQKPFRILDLGTGSGCLLLSLLHEFPNATGLGIDIALRAIEQAQGNAEKLGLKTRALFKKNDWLEDIEGRFDIIISNPPYISQKDIFGLMQEVRGFDPLLALDGGEDGYDPYRLLIPQLPKFLNPDGLAVFEVGQGQSRTIVGLLSQAGFKKVDTHQDLGGIPRCVTASIA